MVRPYLSFGVFFLCNDIAVDLISMWLPCNMIVQLIPRIVLDSLHNIYIFASSIYQAFELQNKIENAGGEVLKNQKSKVTNIQSVGTLALDCFLLSYLS